MPLFHQVLQAFKLVLRTGIIILVILVEYYEPNKVDPFRAGPAAAIKSTLGCCSLLADYRAAYRRHLVVNV